MMDDLASDGFHGAGHSGDRGSAGSIFGEYADRTGSDWREGAPNGGERSDDADRSSAKGPRFPGISVGGWSPSRRPPRHTSRTVPYRHRVADHLRDVKDPARWEFIGIEAARDLGHVRTGMTYNREYGTSAGFFEKPGRLQFLEGPNEDAVASHLELYPRALDFQFQGMVMLFRRPDSRIIRKYPDVLIEYDDNTVRVGEIKSNALWFEAEAVRRPLDRMDLALSSIGIEPILRIRGEPFRTESSLRAHSIALEARLTPFDPEADPRTVRGVVQAGGGAVPYAAVVDALGGVSAGAVDRLYAMLLRRIVSFDLSLEPSAGTIVTAPRPAKAYALRALLSRFAPKAA
jgi:hypothetical protein